MVRPRRNADGFGVDLLALSLFFCLLAAVVGLFALAEVETAATEAAAATTAAAAANYQPIDNSKAEELRSAVQSAQRLLDEQRNLARKIDYSITTRAVKTLGEETKRYRKGTLVSTQFADAEAAEKVLSDELNRLPPTPTPTLAPQPPDRPEELRGEYQGPYVLLECFQGYATVYPGAWRISDSPHEAEWQKLMNQIIKTGFVAIVVRPSGWTNGAYDKLQKRIFAQLGPSSTVGRVTFPLRVDDSIKPYLPGG